MVTVRLLIVKASIAVLILPKASEYVSLLSVVTVHDCPATVPLYVVSVETPEIFIVPCLLALNVGSAFLAATTVLLVSIDLSCIVSMS